MDKGWYITIHVYRPVKIGKDVAFKWDNSPNGPNQASAWTVDAESVLWTKLNVAPYLVRRGSRHGQDPFELKKIDDKQMKEIRDSYFGQLASL